MCLMLLVKFVIVNVFIHFSEFCYYATSSRIHVLVLHNGEWKPTRENNSWMFCAKASKGLGVSRDITYGNLVDRLYDLLRVDKGKYELVLKVLF